VRYRRDMEEDDLTDPKAERRATRRRREAKGMQVSNRNLRTLAQERDTQRRRNAERGLGPLTDDELERYGPQGGARS